MNGKDSLERLASKLSSVKIRNIEDIAKSTVAQDRENYVQNFAENIVKEKLDASSLQYSRTEDEALLVQYNGEKFLVAVAPEEIVPKDGKEYVKRHAHKIRDAVEQNKASGAIYFMPFLMNNSKTRDVLKNEISVGLVNLPYDEKGLERRVCSYLSMNQ